MTTKKSDQGDLEKDDLVLPGLEDKPIVETPPVVVDPPKPTDPPKPIDPPKPVVLNDELEGDEGLPFKKPEDKPTDPPVVETPPVEENIFEIPEQEKPKPTDPPKPEYDFVGFGKDLGIDITENNKETLKNAVIKKIDEAKTKVEPDLTKYNEQQKLVISWLEDGGTLDEFFNPLKAIDDFNAMPDDEKIIDYLQTEENMTEPEAKKKLGEILDAGTFDEYINKVNTLVGTLRKDRIDSVMAGIKKAQDTRLAQISQAKEKEKTELCKVIDSISEFMGMPVDQKFKDAMKEKVSSGKLVIENNNARTQVLGHYFSLYGDKILAKMAKDAKTAGDAAYNRGVQTARGGLSNTPIKPDLTAGHSSGGVDPDKSPVEGLKNIDKDAKEGFPS